MILPPQPPYGLNHRLLHFAGLQLTVATSLWLDLPQENLEQVGVETLIEEDAHPGQTSSLLTNASVSCESTMGRTLFGWPKTSLSLSVAAEKETRLYLYRLTPDAGWG